MAAGQTEKRRAGFRPDMATWLGILLAAGGILGGMIQEGGKLSQLTKLTPALIVFGGTLGAVMVTTPMHILVRAIRRLGAVFFEHPSTPEAAIDEIITFASKARKNGIVSLERDADAVEDPFLRKALTLAVDGTDIQELRKMMDLELSLREQRGEEEAKVFESAGGYSPTIGIIGAVLGLIQVMQHIDNVEEVGKGIAVAFVATVYGVGAANIFFLPAASKLRARTHQAAQLCELMLEGVIGIVEGLNPKLIRSKLEAFCEPGDVGRRRKIRVAEEAEGVPNPARAGNLP